MRWDQRCPRCGSEETDLYGKIIKGQTRARFGCYLCGAVFMDNLEGELRPVYLCDYSLIQELKRREHQEWVEELAILRAQADELERRVYG